MFASRLTAIAGAVAIAGFASAAQANDGLYVGGIGSLMLVDDSDYGDGTPDIENSYGTGFGISGIVGYGFGGIFRLEGEVSYKDSDVDELTANNVEIETDGGVDVLAGMISGYFDIHTGTPFTPYIGAGVGLARVGADVDVPALGGNLVDDDDTGLAYQVAVGVGYAVNPRVTIFGGYKYFTAPDLEFTDSLVSSQFEAELQSHNFEIGVRVLF